MGTSRVARRRRRGGRALRRRTLLGLEHLELRQLLASWPVWQPVGPAPVTGALVDGMTLAESPSAGVVQVLLPDPSLPGTLYAGTAEGGIWKTTNALDPRPTWTPLTDAARVSPRYAELGAFAFLPASIGALTFDTADASHQTLYAGIGITDPESNTRPFGMLRTRDGGQSWEHVVDAAGLPTGLNISGLAVHGERIVVSALGVQAGAGPADLYYSVDGGATFVPVDHPQHEYFRDVNDLVGDSGDAALMYVAELPTSDGQGGNATAGGVWRINAAQGVWTVEDITDRQAGSAMETQLAASHTVRLAAGRQGELYAGIMTDGRLSSLFFTRDARADTVRWQRVALPRYEESQVALHADSHVARGLWVPLAIAADPRDAWVVYLGGDRQPGDLGTPPDDWFGPDGTNAVGATRATGRILRGELRHDAEGRIVTTIWQPVTHAGAVPEGTPTPPVVSASTELPIRIGAPSHGLAPGDRVMVYDVAGNTAANGLWTITVDDADHFRLDGADGSASAAHVAGTGRWFRYAGGTAPAPDVRDLAFDAAGNLIAGGGGGVYRKTAPQSPVGAWSGVNGNLQIASVASLQWDGQRHTAGGSLAGGGAAVQTARGQLAWAQWSGAGTQLYAIADGDAQRVVYYDGDLSRGELRRQTVDLAAGTTEVQAPALRVDALDWNGVPVGLALHPFDYGFDEGFNLAARGLPRLAASPVNPRRLVISAGHVYESTNGGDTLVPLDALVDRNHDGADNDGDGRVDDGNEYMAGVLTAPVTAVAYGELGPAGADAQDALYLAMYDNLYQHIYLREPGQTSLQLVYRDPSRVRQLVVDPRDWRHVFAVATSGLLESVDAGATWATVATLPEATDEVVLLPAAHVDTLVARSRQSGLRAIQHAPLQDQQAAAWLYVTGNVPLTSDFYRATDLEYDRRDDILAVATAGRGVWTLAQASRLLTLPARTGDITQLDLHPLMRGSQYQLVEARIQGGEVGQPPDLLITGDAARGYELRRVLDEAGHSQRVAALHAPTDLEQGEGGAAGPGFDTSGRLYLEPSLAADLEDDADAGAAGFQGRLQLTVRFTDAAGHEQSAVWTVAVDPGHSADAWSSISLNATPLDARRIEHRLRFLGLLPPVPEEGGEGLEGEPAHPRLAADVAAALGLFQAMIDPQGELLPADAPSELSFHTIRWLNSPRAPRWTEYHGVGSDERYGANWIVDLLDRVVGPSAESRTEFGQQLDAAGIQVAALSAADGTVGRGGMAVSWTIPAMPDAAAVRLIVDLALRLQREAAARYGAGHADPALGLEAEGLPMAGVLVPTADLRDAINQGVDDGQGGRLGPVPAPTGFDGPGRVVAELPAQRMEVRFAAPTLDRSVAAHESDTLASILAALRQVGAGIDRVAASAVPLVAGAGLPFVKEGLDGVLRIGDTLQDVADRLQATVTLEGTHAVTGDIDREIALLVVPERHAPIVVRLQPGSASAEEFATALNAAWGADAPLRAGNTPDNRLTLSTTSQVRAESVALTTLRWESGDPGVPFGQLPREGDDPPGAHFRIGLTIDGLGGDGMAGTRLVVDPLDVRVLARPGAGDEDVAWPDTRDNVSLDDLAADFNAALRLVPVPPVPAGAAPGHLGLYVTVLVEGGHLVVASRHAGVEEIRFEVVAQENGRQLPTLGFASGTAREDAPGSAAREAAEVLGLGRARELAEPRFRTVAGLMRTLAEEMSALGLLQDELQWTYDAVSESVLIDAALGAAFTAQVPLDFTDGFDLGPLGRLEFTARATASLQANARLSLRLGIDLGERDTGQRLSADSRLDALPGGVAVTQLVGILADNEPAWARVEGVVSDGVVEDTALTLTVNGGPPEGGTEHAVRVRHAETTENLAAADLVADLDRALAAAGLADRVRAAYDAQLRRFLLVATDPAIRQLATTASAGLGFRQQADNLADLAITVIRVPDGPDDDDEPDVAERYEIDLRGATTLQQVFAAVAEQTGGAVALRAADDAPALIVTGPAGTQLVVGAMESHGWRSTTAQSLGIQGGSGGAELRGRPLASRDIVDRLFLAEPAAGASTLQVGLSLRAADVDLRAALGLIGFAVTTVEPLELGFTLPLRLRDPGAGDAHDGRLTLRELLSADLAAMVDIGGSQQLFDGATLSGALGLSAELFGQPDLIGRLATVRLALRTPGDLGSVTLTPEDVHADLSGLTNLSPAQIAALLRSLVSQLVEQSETSPVFTAKLPLVDRSLGDLVHAVDDVLAWVDTIVAAVDRTRIAELCDELESAVVDLDGPPEGKAALYTALDALNRVWSADAARIPALLVSAMGELQGAAAPYLAELAGHAEELPLLVELRDRLEALQRQIPSLNALAERLNAQLPAELSVVLDLPYYDAAHQERALVVGLRGNFAPGPWDFDLELPEFATGPVELDLEARGALHAAGTVGIGIGLRLGALERFGSPGWDQPGDAAFVIVNPPRDGAGQPLNPRLVPTALGLRAGFAVSGSGSVRFGGLELIEATADASLLTARRAEVDVQGGAATLPDGDEPRGADPRFVIVAAVDGPFDTRSPDGQRDVTVLPPEYFRVVGDRIEFVVDTQASHYVADLPARVAVTYQTEAAPPSPADPAAADQQAAVTIDFGQPVVDDNVLGAVPLADLFRDGGVQPRVTAAGLLTAALDARFLGDEIADAVTVAVALDQLTSPILTVDTARLTSIWDQLDFDLLSIFDGLERLLQLLEQGLRSEVARELPLIGDLDPRVVRDVREDFVTPLHQFLRDQGGSLAEVQESLRRRIYDLLGPDGLDLLRDLSGDGRVGDVNGDGTVAADELDDDIHVVLNKDRIEFQVLLGGQETLGYVDFTSGLAGLPLQAQGGVAIDLDYQFLFGAGFHRTEGFYYLGNDGSLVDDRGQPRPELALDLDVSLQTVERGGEQVPASLTLDLFLLSFAATDRGDTGFRGRLSLDVAGDAQGRLRLNDLAERSFGEVFAASLTADVTIDLLLEARLDADLPRLAATLTAGFGFSLMTINGELRSQFTAPYFALDDITLDLGDFLGRYLGPAITTVSDILEPVAPVVDLLTEPIPGISELSELVGGGPITLLDLAAIMDPARARAARQFVNVVQSLETITAALDTTDGVVLHLGGVTFAGDGLATAGWNRDVALVGPGGGEPEGGGVTSQLRTPAEGLATQLRRTGAGNVVSRLQRPPDEEGSDDGLGIKLHFLDLANVLKIVLGQTVDVISWDIPRFNLDFGWSQRFPVFPTPPISIEVGLNVGFAVDLSVGYDTRGLETGHFADGFYFGDREEVFAGADVDEFQFRLGATVAALLDVVVASAGIEGELRGELTANWRDVDQNGKMYLDEIGAIIAQDGVGCLFDLEAEVRAILRLVWEVLFASGSYDIVDVTVISVDNRSCCPRLRPAHVADGSESDELGQTNELPSHAVDYLRADGVPRGLAPPGTLILHAGQYAALRQSGARDTSERFVVTQLAPGVFEVDGQGMVARYSGVTRILFDGGAGSDRLELVGLGASADDPGNPGVDVPVYAFGGDGHDVLWGGSARDVLIGDAGDDRLDARGGDDFLDGGDGDDVLVGGAGEDLLLGGRGNDRVQGNGGADIVGGGAGDDVLYGGNAPDEPRDLGADGADALNGGPGRDTLFGGAGDDELRGGSGHDHLHGDQGQDSLWGDSGHDLVDGGPGDDPFLYGGDGNDLVIGDDGSDRLFGGWGNDAILAHRLVEGEIVGADGNYIEGGPDNDFICGDNGRDEIYGGTADDGFTRLDLFARGAVPVLAGGYRLLACTAATVEFEDPPPTRVEGRKFRDDDGDGGRDDDEPWLDGWTIEVYDDVGELVASTTTGVVDLNEDGVADAATEGGVYRFELAAGSYTIREVPRAGYRQTYPVAAAHEITVDGEARVVGLDFGNQPAGAITGWKWDDRNGNGRRDAGEPGLAGVRIFADEIANGVFDAEFEQYFTLTREDDPDTAEDETGRYVLEVPAGSYDIRETVPTAYVQTYPGGAGRHQVMVDEGQVVAGIDFGNHTSLQMPVRFAPTPTAVGEQVLRPFSAPAQEWQPSYVEIWLAADQGAADQAMLSVWYDPRISVPADVVFGEEFAGTAQVETAAGRIDLVATRQHDPSQPRLAALLARIRLSHPSLPAGQGFHALGDYAIGLRITDASARLANQAVLVPDVRLPADMVVRAEPFDVNDDDVVNTADYQMLASFFGKFVDQRPASRVVDFDRSGRVDAGDVGLLIPHFGRMRPPSGEPDDDANIFVVNATADPGDGVPNANEMTLREAITAANATPNLSKPDRIRFNIPPQDPGHVYYRDDGVAGTVSPGQVTRTTVPDDTLLTDADPDWPHSWYAIAVQGTLPAIMDAVVMDGYSQPGAVANSLPLGGNAVLRIEIQGAVAGSNASGLWLTGDGITLSGLVINRFRGSLAQFTGYGIYVDRSDNNVIDGNYLGTDVAGLIDLGNATNGVFLRSSFNNRVGGAATAARNVVSGNDGWGINIFGAGQHTLQGNYIGINAVGSAALGNSSGVWLESATLNTIGGTVAGAGNVISGNMVSGIALMGFGFDNLVVGNLIGTDPTGNIDLGNGSDGVRVEQNGNLIGGAAVGARNVISGNNSYGVRITGTRATGNVIQGNWIGTDAAGSAAVGNGTGIAILSGAAGNIVGGSAVGAGNVIAGSGFGVSIQQSNGNRVLGNLIGTRADGVTPLGHTYTGITLADARDNVIGGTEAGAGNAIAYSGLDGVYVQSGTGNSLLGNRIFSNGSLGIDLSPDNVNVNDAGDGDTGANNRQNYPVLTVAAATPSHTSVQGILESTADAAFRVELFAQGASDPSNFGEGQVYLGFVDVLTDSTGVATFTAQLPTPVAVGQFVTATATTLGSGSPPGFGDTSEFSRAVAVTEARDQVRGVRWYDRNANGVREASEPGVAGATIFADLNANGRFDGGEPRAVTAADDPLTAEDELGQYRLNGIPLGVPVTILERPTDGVAASYPPPQLIGATFDGFLVDVDRATGAARFPRAIGSSQPLTGWIGMSRSPTDGLLYGITEDVDEDDDLEGSQLYVLDPRSGQATWVAALVDPLDYDPPPVWLREGDLAFDPTSGALYAVTDWFRWVGGQTIREPRLLMVHLDTGFVSWIGALPAGVQADAMAFDDAGRLFVADLEGGALLEIDKTTGARLKQVQWDRQHLGEYAGMAVEPQTGDLYLAAGGPRDPSQPGAAPQLYRARRNSAGTWQAELEVLGRHDLPLAAAMFATGWGHRLVLAADQQMSDVNFGAYVWTEIVDGRDAVHAADGDDQVYGDNVVLRAGVISRGDADILVGGRGADQVHGQESDDTLWGDGPDIDALYGGAGAGDDAIHGGQGVDTVWQVVDANQTLTDVSLTGQGNDALSGIEHAVLTGGASANEFTTFGFLAGGVTLHGLAGEDRLGGTRHADTLHGGEGSDVLQGGDGDDRYVFELPVAAAEDRVHEVPGLAGGDDWLDFGAFPASVDLVVHLDRETAATDGSHTVRVMAGWIENVVGGAGNDRLVGSFERNRLEGGPGDDTLDGRGGDDTFVGGAGDDQLIGGKDNDRFVFADAEGTERDTMTAGGGVDELDFSQLSLGARLRVTLSEDTIAVHDSPAGDRKVTAIDFAQVENVVGTAGDDVLSDNQAANRLVGGRGDDRYVLTSASPADTIVEAADGGVDWLDAAALTHDLRADLSHAAIVVVDADLGAQRVLGDGRNLERFTGGRGDDVVLGNDQDNVLEGGSGDDSLSGGAGRDVLIGGAGHDSLAGGLGDDRYVFRDAGVAEHDVLEDADGPEGGQDVLDFSQIQLNSVDVDLERGTASVGLRSVEIRSPFRIETVWGGALDDRIRGHNFTANRLVGGPGNDLLNGRGGDDLLIGGAGDDVYEFDAPNAVEHDQIDERNIARDSDGAPLLDERGRLIYANGGVDTLDFHLLAAPVHVDLDAVEEVAWHVEPADLNKRRSVTLLDGARGADLEHAIGGLAGDDLRGNRSANRLEGREGDDTLDGRGGDDVLVGGAGTNLLIGGAGDDRYVFAAGVAAWDTLVENAGSVVGGVLSLGGSDSLDFRNVAEVESFDSGHFVPGIDPYDGQDRIPELFPGVIPGVLRVDLHERATERSDQTRTGAHFESVLLAGGEAIGAGLSDDVAVAERPAGNLTDVGVAGTDPAWPPAGTDAHDHPLGEPVLEAPLLELQLVAVGAPTPDGATALPAPLLVALPGGEIYVELWARSLADPAAGIAGGWVDIPYASSRVAAGPPVWAPGLDLVSGLVDADAGLINDLGGVILDLAVGRAPQWVRLAYVPFTVLGGAELEFSLLPGAWPFALVGRGNIAWADVRRTGATVAVAPVPQPPRITAPVSQVVPARRTTTLELVQVSDPDGAPEGRLRMTLEARHGVVVFNASGVAIVEGASGSVRVIFEGTASAVNAALRTLGYRSDTGFAGHDTLTVVAQERDAQGEAGLSAAATIDLEVPGAIVYRNPRDPLDVSDDGVVSPRDALILINLLNRAGGSVELQPPTPYDHPPPFVDPSGDYWVSPRDPLLVINYLNRRWSEGDAEGEPILAGEAAATPKTAATARTERDEERAAWHWLLARDITWRYWFEEQAEEEAEEPEGFGKWFLGPTACSQGPRGQ